MDTLLLDTVEWDLVTDISGNLAVASVPYSLAQDAASAIRTFLSEVYYDTTLGVPYLQFILGHQPALSLVKAQMQQAAETVPDVVAAACFINGLSASRQLTGQVQVTDANGDVTVAAF